jgi:hypothetical protein
MYDALHGRLFLLARNLPPFRRRFVQALDKVCRTQSHSVKEKQDFVGKFTSTIEKLN